MDVRGGGGGGNPFSLPSVGGGGGGGKGSSMSSSKPGGGGGGRGGSPEPLIYFDRALESTLWIYFSFFQIHLTKYFGHLPIDAISDVERHKINLPG